jgi:hypothetical protein
LIREEGGREGFFDELEVCEGEDCACTLYIEDGMKQLTAEITWIKLRNTAPLYMKMGTPTVYENE